MLSVALLDERNHVTGADVSHEPIHLGLSAE
jgi:hypothetical protein